MRTTFVTAAASLLSLASARVVGFAVPSTVAPDSTVKVEIIAENYIQSTQDVAFSFGLSPSNTSYPGSLGTYLDSKFLGPDFSNIIGNITHYVHIPATTKEGEYVFGGAHFSLIGAVYSPAIANYAANVTVGETTSSEYVRSELVPGQ